MAPSTNFLTVPVEAFVAEAAVQALHEGILHRLARGDVMPLDAAIFLPDQHRPAGQFRAVVADYHQRQATLFSEVVQFACDTNSGERRVDYERQTLSGEVIDDHQHPEAPAVSQHVRDEVEAPALVWALRDRHGRPGAERTLSAATAPHRQTLLAVKAEELLVVQ